MGCWLLIVFSALNTSVCLLSLEPILMPAHDAKPPIEEPDVIVCWLRIGFGTEL